MKNFNDFNFSGKAVLLRVDFNVPLDEHQNITDDTRIMASMPTINALVAQGAKTIIMAHFGRPKGKVNPEFSLKPVHGYLEKVLGKPVKYVDNILDESALSEVRSMIPGDVTLLENVRFYAEEEAGDRDFAQKLAKFGDFYINDAFGAAHRAHASTAVIAEFFKNNACFGLLMGDEVASLDKIFNSGQKPVTALVGGAKVSSKIDILKNLLSKVDRLIIGGGMAYTFLKAQGGKIGNSLVEEDRLQLALEILEAAKTNNVQVYLPVDSHNSSAFSNDAERSFSPALEIPDGMMGLDIGPKTIAQYAEAIKTSKTILWNGPMGVFEMSSFENGTREIGQAIAEATANGAFSLVGGGDSVAAVKQFDLSDKVSYVSTGGGAMLEYLEGKVLPGIAAIV
jgi:phosphoglycerate kinase